MAIRRLVAVVRGVGGGRRGVRVLLRHVHVRPLAQEERTVRPSAGAAVRQPGRGGAGRGTPVDVLRPFVQGVPRHRLRRILPDAHAAPDDLRPGTREPRADQGFRALHGSRDVQRDSGREPAEQRAVQHERRTVEDHAHQAQPGVYVRQAETHARADGRVRRSADSQRGRRAGRLRRSHGSARRPRRLRDGRDRHVRVRTAAERHRRPRVGVPQTRQVAVRAVVPVSRQGTRLDGVAEAAESVAHIRFPARSHPVLRRCVCRHNEVPGRTRRRQERRDAIADTSPRRSGREQNGTVVG